MHYTVFNGDADGILAAVQLHLHAPVDSVSVTGVKRDIALLQQVVPQAGDVIHVLDISMQKNHAALEQCLAQGATVLYADHHNPGEIPTHANLAAHIDVDANTCTALIVSDLLGRAHHLWAIAAAYGDNLFARAETEADLLGLSATEKQQLNALGTYVNYNGYGVHIDDLHFHPAVLLKALLKYPNPFAVIADTESVFHRLAEAYAADMAQAQGAQVRMDNASCKVIELANAPWARRVSGVIGNQLANDHPDKAHGVLTLNADGSYTVSIRAPLNNKQGAAAVAEQFATGGGRAGAAGINALPAEQVEQFCQALNKMYT